MRGRKAAIAAAGLCFMSAGCLVMVSGSSYALWWMWASIVISVAALGFMLRCIKTWNQPKEQDRDAGSS